MPYKAYASDYTLNVETILVVHSFGEWPNDIWNKMHFCIELYFTYFYILDTEVSQPVFRDDLLRAIRKLRILGNGFTVLTVGSLQLVQSVPGELTMDHTNILQCAQVSNAVCGQACVSSTIRRFSATTDLFPLFSKNTHPKTKHTRG